MHTMEMAIYCVYTWVHLCCLLVRTCIVSGMEDQESDQESSPAVLEMSLGKFIKPS